MENIKVNDIVQFSNGKIGTDIDLNCEIEFISNDSRKVGKNWIYLAIKGERLDGHNFVNQALENGATCCIVSEEGFEKSILVEDTYKALKDIAIGYKAKYDINYLAVTGSSGKTTTKDMLFFALNENEKTLRNIGNLNSEIGLPMTLLNLDDSYKNAICEMGMYYLGDIDYLAEIVKPKVAIITNVGTAHIQNLKTRENILKAKMEIANYMGKNDTLIINGDNDMLSTVNADDKKYTLLKFGFGEHNDIKVIEYNFNDFGFFVKAQIIDEVVEFSFEKGGGKHNILNAISVLGACKVLGYSLRKSILGLQKYEPSSFRMEKKEIGDKVIINDSYNANPDSMRAAISILEDIKAERKVAILADMLELGENSKNYHYEIGEFAADYVDLLIAIGNEAKYIAEGAKGKIEVHYFKNNEEANLGIQKLLLPKDVILVKGSRGMRLEEVADKIC